MTGRLPGSETPRGKNSFLLLLLPLYLTRICYVVLCVVGHSSASGLSAACLLVLLPACLLGCLLPAAPAGACAFVVASEYTRFF